jgi:hypothetical protein
MNDSKTYYYLIGEYRDGSEGIAFGDYDKRVVKQEMCDERQQLREEFKSVRIVKGLDNVAPQLQTVTN